MKFFLKLCFIIILLIISINPADSLELAVENVKDFKVVDWNNDGKTDIVLYFIDGKFGVMLNLSKNDSEFNFSEIKYLSKQTEKNEENMKNAISGENNAYAVNRSKDNIKKSDVENEKGISISKEELL
nr:hypothetical protein [Candidatus Dependentiae bacterium]